MFKTTLCHHLSKDYVVEFLVYRTVVIDGFDNIQIGNKEPCAFGWWIDIVIQKQIKIGFLNPNGMEIIFGNEESEKQYDRIYEAADDDRKKELDALNSSDVVYNINVNRQLKDADGNTLMGAATLYNFETNQVDLNINPTDHEGDLIAMLGDELTHAFQFESGDLGFVESGGYSAAVGYDIQDEVDSKLGAENAVNSVNAKEGGGLQLTGMTKRFLTAYNSASDIDKDKAATQFFKKDKTGRQYMSDFSSRKMGVQSNIEKEISGYINSGYNITNYVYRVNGETIKQK